MQYRCVTDTQPASQTRCRSKDTAFYVARVTTHVYHLTQVLYFVEWAVILYYCRPNIADNCFVSEHRPTVRTVLRPACMWDYTGVSAYVGHVCMTDGRLTAWSTPGVSAIASLVINISRNTCQQCGMKGK